MSIFLNNDSKIIVQGMTGSEGQKHTRRMIAVRGIIRMITLTKEKRR